MVLTDSDRKSDTWLRLKAYLEQRQQILRVQNDGDLDEGKTAKLRGRLAEVTDMLALADTAPRVETVKFE